MGKWLWRPGGEAHYFEESADAPLCRGVWKREARYGVCEPMAKYCCKKCRRVILRRRKKPQQDKLFA